MWAQACMAAAQAHWRAPTRFLPIPPPCPPATTARCGLWTPPPAPSPQVLEYFKQFGENSEAGCAITQCHEAMAASGVSLEQIRNEVNQLVSDGHLYSTIDDDHYKAI